jgi:hypothetical protein
MLISHLRLSIIKRLFKIIIKTHFYLKSKIAGDKNLYNLMNYFILTLIIKILKKIDTNLKLNCIIRIVNLKIPRFKF